jgi:ppGpp synthetase/RelA/SpoT-type nucleotidyltranferase
MTISLESVKDQYDRLAPRYHNLKDELVYILKNEMECRGILIHLIDGRVKKIDSLVAKADRQNSEKPFDTVSDICGVRVICLFRSDLSRIGEAIEETFEMVSKDDKILGKPDEEFGYFPIHYVGKLPQRFSGPRYDGIKELKFEVQVRTIAMHAWDTISHYLNYKTPSAIPSDLRRDFTALSALFHLADSQFERFFQAGQQSRKEAERLALDEGAMTKEEINLDTLTAFLQHRYPDREHANAALVSWLAEALVNSGYATIADVERDLKRSEVAFEAYEKKYHPGVTRGRWPDTVIVNCSLGIANEDFLNYVISLYPHDERAESFKAKFQEFRSLLADTKD